MSDAVNLLPVSIRRARACQRACAWWSGIAAVAFVVAGAWALRARASIGDGGRELSRLLGERTRNVETLKLQVGRVSGELSMVQKELEVADRIQSRPDWSDLLGLLGEIIGPEAVIESCRITEASQVGGVKSTPGTKANAKSPKDGGEAAPLVEVGYVLQITGAAKDQRVVSELVTAMEGTGLFTKTTQQSRRRSLLQGEAVGFEVRAEMPAFVEANP